jgi:hypothetical protein
MNASEFSSRLVALVLSVMVSTGIFAAINVGFPPLA